MLPSPVKLMHFGNHFAKKKEIVVKKIAIVGAGYVGLVTGTCFAHKGNHVTIIDTDKNKIKNLLQGIVPFYEPGLDLLVKQTLEQGTLTVSSTIKEALASYPEIIFLCVGTPSLPDGSADLSHVYNAAAEIGQTLSEYALVVNKSTAPVGTSKAIQMIIQQNLAARSSSVSFDIASNPEFLKEGEALGDFLHPDRIVIGVKTRTAEQILHSLYKPFIKQDNQFVPMNVESAELTKYASNAMLATRISFMNELALLADKVGADIDAIKQGMAGDKRIGPSFLNAGIGYGGSCFPKDVSALAATGRHHQQQMSIVEAVDQANKRQRKWFIDQIFGHYGQLLGHKKIGIWGLAFKPETDDTRCAPSLDIINALYEKGCQIHVYDPVVTQSMLPLLSSKVTFHPHAHEVLDVSDALVIVTEWKEFKMIDPHIFMHLHDKVIFDGRNCFDPLLMRELGLRYTCVGRNSLTSNPSLHKVLRSSPLVSVNPL